MLAKLDGLCEYDVRRPLTVTGTNLLGLVKHLATWEARYLGEVFDRPFPEPLPRWDVEAERLADMWATEHESRSDVEAARLLGIPSGTVKTRHRAMLLRPRPRSSH